MVLAGREMFTQIAARLMSQGNDSCAAEADIQFLGVLDYDLSVRLDVLGEIQNVNRRY